MKTQAYWDRVDAVTLQVRYLLELPVDLLQRMWLTRGGDQVLGFDVEAIQAALSLRQSRFF